VGTTSDTRRGGGTATVSASRWASDRPRRAGVAAGARRRRWPHLFVGLLLVVACAVGVVVLSQGLSDRRPVLVVARPVLAGQVLTAADVRQVHVAADASVAVIGADRLIEVVGTTAAVDLRAGSLVTEAVLGPAEVPAAGESVVALEVKPGRYPPRLRAGASVRIVPVANPDAGKTPVEAPEGGWEAVVLDVAVSQAAQSTTVVTLRMPDGDAGQVAALADDAASVVLMSGGGG
jgi:hypothetical protein